MIYRLFILLLALPMLATCQPRPASPNLVPQPLSVQMVDGRFTLNAETRVYFPANKPEWETAAQYFMAMAKSSANLSLTAQPFTNTIRETRQNAIYLLPDASIKGDEAYQLEVKPTVVLIKAQSAAGAFYAVQTLRQLFPPTLNARMAVSTEPSPVNAPLPGISAPCCRIDDAPRFQYRGLHLDVGRHFFPVDFVKRYIDLLAAHKLNTFHWHLTEDQGWRIEIKKYPRLHTVGGCRTETLVGHYGDQPETFDGQKHCGFYTQEEVKEVVEYAKKRFVTIVPEIEMPGHAQAALAAYPDLGCTGGPYAVATTWGVHGNVFCAGNDKVFTFLDDVLGEVCALFPGTYVHVGGDECPKDQWKKCLKCQKRMHDEKLKDEHELQSYFIRRAEQMLAKRKRKLIGWDEILEGGLAPNATVMSWRGIEGGIAAAKAGHDVIMTPGSNCYLDYYQSEGESEPLAIGGYLPLEKVYEYEPVPTELSEKEAKYILGVQGNVWTEYIDTPEKMDYMVYPRACALAEVAWTSKNLRSWPDFARRMRLHFQRLDAMGVNYAKSYYDIKARFEDGKVTLSAVDKGIEIRYTLDGQEPNAGSTLYRTPISLSQTSTLKAVAIVSGVPAGKTTTATFLIHKASGKPYKLTTAPERYTGGATYGLTNGVTGGIKSWNNWVGIVNRDLDPVIDLGAETPVEKVKLQYVDGRGSWIYPPKRIEVYGSEDGQQFVLIAGKDIVTEAAAGNKVVPVEIATPGARPRYLKVVATPFGIIPEGQPGAGNGAWLFVDEIIVE